MWDISDIIENQIWFVNWNNQILVTRLSVETRYVIISLAANYWKRSWAGYAKIIGEAAQILIFTIKVRNCRLILPPVNG